MIFSSLKKRRSFCAVLLMVLLMMPFHVFAASTSGTHTPVENVTVKVSGATDNSMTDGVITVTAKGSGGLFGIGASAKTTTITVTNDSEAKATVSFDWTATSVNQLVIDGTTYTGTSGSFSKLLDPGASFTVTITTAKNSTENKLVMNDFAVEAAAASSTVTINYDSTLGNVTAGGAAVSNGAAVENITADDGVALVATANSGATFLGWYNDADNSFLSSNPSYTLKPASDMTVGAVFVNSDSNAWFLVDGAYMFDDLNAAAAKGTTIVLMHDGTLPAGNYTIPTGDTLLIPHNSSNSTATDGVVKDTNTNNAGSAYRTLKVPADASITVNGTVIVNASVCTKAGGRNSGSIYGGYGKMVLDGTMTINSGANLYARGYIVGSNHTSDYSARTGHITVKSGGNVYMLLQMTDWRGGGCVTAVMGSTFPVSSYYFQNIMVETTYEQGAHLYARAAIQITLIGVVQENALLVGTSTDKNAMFQLTDGSVTTNYQYNGDRMLFFLDGDVVINKVAVKIATYNMTTDGKVIPLNSNMDIYIRDGGSVTTSKDIKFLPGTKMVVEDGGTFNSSGMTYLYSNADYQASYRLNSAKGRTRLNVPGLIQSGGSTIVEGDSEIRIAGDVNITGSGRIWASNSHTKGIVGLNGGAISFESVQSSDDTASVNEVVNTTESATAFTSWKSAIALLAGYSTSADDYKPFSTPGAGIYYADGSWVSDTNAMWYQSKESVAATCTEGGYVLYNCTGGEGRKVSDGTSATGHSYGEWVLTTRPTGSTNGIETQTCSKCGDEQTREVIAVAQTTIAGGTEMYCISLQEAIKNTSDGFITMLADTTESTYTIDKAVTIDLNKFEVEVGGVAYGVTVTGIDSGTNGFQSVPGTNLGSINVAAVAPEAAVNGKYYIAITGDGVTTFHRVAVAVTSCQFIYDKPNNGRYIVVQGTFKGTDQSVAKLTDLGFVFSDSLGTTKAGEAMNVISDGKNDGTTCPFYFERAFDGVSASTVKALMEFSTRTSPIMSNPTEDLVKLYEDFLSSILKGGG